MDGIGSARRPGRRALLFGIARRTVLLAPIALACLAFGSSTAAASAQEIGFNANAYGTQARVGSTVTSGKSAAVSLTCTSKSGISRSNTTATVNVPGVLSTGTIDTTAASTPTASGVASTSSATTQGVSLLGGLITATAVESASTTSYDDSTNAFGTSAAGTTFTDLVVAGVPIANTPAPNTKITLPGVGYVILNQQKSSVGATSASMNVTGIHVVVNLSTPLAPVGTQLWVSVAKSSLAGPVTGLLNGYAYGTSATLGTAVIAGNSFPKYMGCLGTGGATKSNTGVGVSIPNVLGSGTIEDTANGTVSSNEVAGEMTSTIENLNLLSGAVTANAIKADVTADGNPATLGDNSSFVGLKVAGHPKITDSVPPNTRLTLPGIGTLWLHRRIETPNGIKVIMIQLIIRSSSAPLPLGAVVDIGYARVHVS